MSTMVSGKGGGIKEIEPGPYLARCIRIIFLGTQAGKFGPKEKVMIQWELPTELIEGGEFDGKPRFISDTYNATIGEGSNLRKILEGWRCRAFTEEEIEAFDLKNILGVPCNIQIKHDENGKAKIDGVSKPMKGMECPPQMNPSVLFDFQEWIRGDTAMDVIFSEMSDKMKAWIRRSEEYQDTFGGGNDPPESGGNVPF